MRSGFSCLNRQEIVVAGEKKLRSHFSNQCQGQTLFYIFEKQISFNTKYTKKLDFFHCFKNNKSNATKIALRRKQRVFTF